MAVTVDLDWTLPYRGQRAPVFARNAVATSQPLATQAGVQMLRQGGNAIDAAIATAIALTVVEPTMNGIGGDLFAIVWHAGALHGLNSSGRAPAAMTPQRFAGLSAMPKIGWDTVTVPGTVAGWVALSERFGQLSFDALFEPAIRYARDGFLVSPSIARQWATQVETLAKQPGFAEAFMPGGRAPRVGEVFRQPDQARTLESIAATRGESFYRGELAARIAAFAKECNALLTEADLAAHRADWVTPLASPYRGVTLHEIPPNGSGMAAQIALGLLDQFDMGALPVDSADSIHLQVEAMKLAFADVHAHVADPAHMRIRAESLLDPGYLRERARLIDPRRASEHPHGVPSSGGTVYLTAADEQGTMVSFIQSNFKGFGSGVVVPGTGIALHNRGMGFSLEPGHPNQVAGGKRPFHTIIPAFVTRNGQPLMSFGVMGGNMQPQGHLQMMVRMFDYGQNPQACADGPRWRIDDQQALTLEAAYAGSVADELARRGHRQVTVSPADSLEFGSAQLILRLDDGYAAASEPRRDGQAAGF